MRARFSVLIVKLAVLVVDVAPVSSTAASNVAPSLKVTVPCGWVTMPVTVAMTVTV